MSNLQIKNIPEDLHDQLRALAEAEGRSVRDFVLQMLREEVARREFFERWRRRPRSKGLRPAAGDLEAVRASNEEG